MITIRGSGEKLKDILTYEPVGKYSIIIDSNGFELSIGSMTPETEALDFKVTVRVATNDINEVIAYLQQFSGEWPKEELNGK